MGSEISRSQIQQAIMALPKEQGIVINRKTASAFMHAIETAFPWFLRSGNLMVPDWEYVKEGLQKYLREKGPDSLSVATFSLWKLVKDALLSPDVKVCEFLQ